MTVTRRQLLVVALVTAVAVLIIVAVTAVVIAAIKSTSIRDAQRDNTQTIDSSAETLKIIKACTTPGEDCYDRGQKQTADIISSINDVAVYAAACADQRGVQGEDEIYACVIHRLAEAAATTKR